MALITLKKDKIFKFNQYLSIRKAIDVLNGHSCERNR